MSGRDPNRLRYEHSMAPISLKTFVVRVATAVMLGMLVAALHIPGVDVANAAEAMQPIDASVAVALQQEQQASQYAGQGRAAEAEALYKQSLDTVERSLPGDPILAGSLNNVAQFYRTQNRFPEAAELYNRALAIYVASYGDNHTLTATVINNLAGTYLSEGKFDAAEPLYRRGLAASEKLLGPDHFAIAISLDWLAQTHFRQGRYAEAESELKRGVAVAEKATGPDSRLVAKLLDHLISVDKALGRTQEATALTDRAQQIIAKLQQK
jgi:tetratricopeptide (TPR) repeat protein